jgi:hypothetical protein
VARTPASNIKQRVVNSGTNPDLTRQEINRAQREAKRKAESNTFDQFVVDDSVRQAPPPMPSASALASVHQAMEVVQPGFVCYRTSKGTITMPDYNNWTPLQIEHAKYEFSTKIEKLNKDWKPYGFTFKLPPPEEHITTTHIRVQDYYGTIKKKSGLNLWWIAVGGLWVGVEYFLTQVLHLKADGFAAIQLKYRKLYEQNMIEMGEGSGFGQDWAPWMKTVFTTVLAAAVIVAVGTYGGRSEYSGEIIEVLSSIVTGDEIVEVDEDGNPIPGKPSLLDKLSSIDLTDMSLSKGMRLLRSFGILGGGGSKEEPEEKPKKPATSNSKKDGLTPKEKRELARQERIRRAEQEDS